MIASDDPIAEDQAGRGPSGDGIAGGKPAPKGESHSGQSSGKPALVTFELVSEGAVGVVWLRNPPHNLLTEPMLSDLADAIENGAKAARVIVLASEGRSFCAGANFRSASAPNPSAGSTFDDFARAFYGQASRVFASPVPLVAAIHGPAIGAGLGLALACDLRVIGAGAWVQANFVHLGIHPGFALSVTLERLVGPGRAADLLLTGRRLTAEEAVSIGLAERLVPSGTELDAACSLAQEIANGAPLAIASTRATLRSDLQALAGRAMDHEREQQSALADTADAVEGVTAMLERRVPRFRGA